MIEYKVCVYETGTKEWYLNGKLHREDGPAIEYETGTKCWYLNSKRHREDGPAIELADGSKFWYLNNQLHREDGPAIEYEDGDKEWWVHGEEVTEEDVMSTSMVGKTVTIDGIQYILTRENTND